MINTDVPTPKELFIPVNHRDLHSLLTHVQGKTPASEALRNYCEGVLKLEQWEVDEIEMVYRIISSLMQTYQSSAMLAVTRASLEVGMAKGQ